MAHQEQIDFCSKIRDSIPEHFINKKVLDAGSWDVNGSNRYLFQNCDYTGVDLAEGVNVDVVSRVDELKSDAGFTDGLFDTIISTEMLEHDMHWQESLQNIVRMLKTGGLFLFTCATEGRVEHGTFCKNPECSHTAKIIEGGWESYYRNLTEADIRGINGLSFIDAFEKYTFEINPESHDLYFWGIKK